MMTTRREFIRVVGAGSTAFLLYPRLTAARGMKTSRLPRSTPEEQGVSSQGVEKFLDSIAASAQEFHSIMILRHGHVIAEGWWAPYSSEHRMETYSASKSFTSTAIGFASDEHLLTVDDPVIQFFPDLLPPTVSDNLAALKIKHLLSMSVGHEKDSILLIEKSQPGTPWAKTFLSLPVVEAPGSHFMYNSGASFMLAAIVQKVTGKTAHDYLRPRLFEPLGISGETWTTNPDGINMGASHLRLKTEDLARFGQFMLQQGRWNGKQLLSRDWIAAATSKQIESGKNDSSWGFGYGYQFWLNPPGGFRADGAFGQYVMVFPDKDAVVVITSESVGKEVTMKTVWDTMYPEFVGQTVPANSGAVSQLQKRLSGLAYPPPTQRSSSPLVKQISGKEFVLDKNEFNARSVVFDFHEDLCDFTLKEDGKTDIRIHNGVNRWLRKGNLKPSPHSLFSLRRIDYDSIVAASATWTDEKTLLLTWRFIETAHGDTLTCTFEGSRVHIQPWFSANKLSGKADDRPALTGTIAV